MSVIERAADAIDNEIDKQGSEQNFCNGRPDHLVLIDGYFDLKNVARAVLQAIHEPSEGMIEVGGEKVFSGSRSAAQVGVSNAWKAMIDAALAEGDVA